MFQPSLAGVVLPSRRCRGCVSATEAGRKGGHRTLFQGHRSSKNGASPELTLIAAACFRDMSASRCRRDEPHGFTVQSGGLAAAAAALQCV